MTAKLLVLIDSPTENTGFAGVGKNLLPRWRPHFERIDIWGIGYDGNPHELPYRIYRAGGNWTDPSNLMRFLNLLQHGDYTHLFLLQDTFLLSANGLPGFLRQICALKNIRLVTYYPVDAPLEADWLDIVKVSAAAATYTEYGLRETRKVWKETRGVAVIPHGVDTTVFKPLPHRLDVRAELFPEWTENFILINVNRNERRKALVQSLQVLKRLNELGVPARLYLHTHTENKGENFDLKQAGAQLGLTYGVEWVAADEFFQKSVGTLSEAQLNELYNAADMCLTTTLGEGWGLSVTEAAAAGVHVIAPNHTSLPDIAAILKGRISLVDCGATPVANPGDNSRVRYPVDVEKMAYQIRAVREMKFPFNRAPLWPAEAEVLSWDRVADEFLKLLIPR